MSETETVAESPDIKELEVPRPASLAEFNGQSALKENLSVAIHSAKERGAALDHILFHGPPGLGKTTLAQIISKELGVNMRQITGPSIQKPADIVSILAGLDERDVLFIDEVHRVPAIAAEMLFVAMEDFRIDLLVGDQQDQGRAISVPLPHFTLVGATTHRGKLPTAFNDRFTIQFPLELYTNEELAFVIERAASMLNLNMDHEAVTEVAGCSRGTPRIALGIMKRIRDYALYRGVTLITQEFARETLTKLGIDRHGLNATDRKYLKLLKDTIKPVGLKTLAASLAEPIESLEMNVEPYLLRQGYIMVTNSGRTLSKQMRNPFTQVRLDL